MTTLYLAWSVSGESRRTFKTFPWDKIPLNVLVSFYYLDRYRNYVPPPQPVRTMLDSGAFSAWKSGKAIDIDALIEETINVEWGESVALDVIGDPDASMRNALYMRDKGSPAYPVFHINDPWDHLVEYCRLFPKVGLSCRFGEPEKKSLWFYDQCYARCWPHKFHSFGWVTEGVLLRYPFDSADSASWNNGPAIWGRWKAFPGLKGPKSINAGVHSLVPEIERYLKMQERLQDRWGDQLRSLREEAENV